MASIARPRSPFERGVAALVRTAARVPPARYAGHRVARALAAKHHVAAIAAVFDTSGHVLVVERAIRPGVPSLPGGWVRRHEDPHGAILRELREELGIAPRLIGPVHCESHATRGKAPSGITIAFAAILDHDVPLVLSAELLSASWCSEPPQNLSVFEREVVFRARNASPAPMRG